MPRHDEWQRRQEAAQAAGDSETHDDSGTGPAGRQEATQPAPALDPVLAELDAELEAHLTALTHCQRCGVTTSHGVPLPAQCVEGGSHVPVQVQPSLTPPLDSDVPTAVGAAQSESNPSSLVVCSDRNLVDWFYVSVLGKHRAVTVGFVACLGIVITAVPLMASLPTSTSWAFVGVGMFLTWVVALRLARWAD